MPRYVREKFSNEELRRFVTLVRHYNYLYDFNHQDHKDYLKTKQTWETIALTCNREGYTADDWKKKWKSMRDIYIKYKRRVQLKVRDGGRVKKWMYADLLSFLDDYVDDNLDIRPEGNAPSYSDEEEIERQFEVSTKQEPSSPFSFDLSAAHPHPLPAAAALPDIASTSRSSPEPSSHLFEEEPRPRKRAREDDSSVLLELLKRSALAQHHQPPPPPQPQLQVVKDADDLLFENYACRMKQLPEGVKGFVRMQLSQIFFNAEHPEMPRMPILALPRPATESPASRPTQAPVEEERIKLPPSEI